MKKSILMFIRHETFMEQDYEILSKYFNVKCIYVEIGIEKTPRRIKDRLINIFKLVNILKSNDIIFLWGLVDPRIVLLSKILKKRVIIAITGAEVAKVPEINYGCMLDPYFSIMSKFIWKCVDKVIVFSEFSKKEALNYIHKDKVQKIYAGIDHRKFTPSTKKEYLVMTVGQIHVGEGWTRVQYKGLHTFVNAAKYLPSIKFLLIGAQGEMLKILKNMAPSNVEFIPPIPLEDIIPYYRIAKVYCQLSYRETFGIAVAEAMLCGCIPVITNRGSLPEVVGDIGIYVPYGDPKATANAILKAISLPDEVGIKCRERIKFLFPKERRERELINLIKMMNF